MEPVSSRVGQYWPQRHEVVGAFWDIDFILFDLLLQQQRATGIKGDLLEIGAMYGRSAIVLGLHRESDEKVIVCDVFESGGTDDENQSENDQSYLSLTRAAFDANYLQFVGTEPVVIQELSASIAMHVRADSIRFAHVDGSHLHAEVSEDIRNVRDLLGRSGILCLDDYRAIHTPGVSAAAWGEVGAGELIPVILTEQKMYATWNEDVADEIGESVRIWARRHQHEAHSGIQEIYGRDVLVVMNPWGAAPRLRRRVLNRVLRRRPAIYPPPSPFLGAPA